MADQYSYNQPPYQPPAPVAAPNSTMSIISLIAGIAGMTILPFIGSIVAVITGHMAKKEIDQSAGRLGGSGMATVGLVLGYIGIVIGVCAICGFGAYMIFMFAVVGYGISSSSDY